MIRFEHVRKVYPGGTVAVDDLSLEVGRGELVVLLGPSGCGKTTTLRMVNRLVDPTSGRITVDGRDIMAEDAVQLRRRIGYVIQNVGLFPHRRIAENVATVPALLGWERPRRRQRAEELLELVGLDPATFAGRYPHQLSGGQQQRVGVARALAADPPVLLMDEPFGAVDPLTRERLQNEFRALQRRLRTTVLFVTHDVGEALLLADRIAAFRVGGVLEQYAAPAELLQAPATDFVAQFLGGDREVRRLSVEYVTAELTSPAAPAELARLPVVPVGANLRRALAVLLAAPEARAAVVDGDGQRIGLLELSGLHAALRRGATEPAG